MRHLTYDVVVIGAGPVGENVADRAAQGGLTAAIVERELVGGECSYWACMPTKGKRRPTQITPDLVVGEVIVVGPDTVARHLKPGRKRLTPLRGADRLAALVGHPDGLAVLELADGHIPEQPPVAVVAGPLGDHDVAELDSATDLQRQLGEVSSTCATSSAV